VRETAVVRKKKKKGPSSTAWLRLASEAFSFSSFFSFGMDYATSFPNSGRFWIKLVCLGALHYQNREAYVAVFSFRSFLVAQHIGIWSWRGGFFFLDAQEMRSC